MRDATRETNEIIICFIMSYIERNTTERSAVFSTTPAAYAQEDDDDTSDTTSPGFGTGSFSRGSDCYKSESWTQNHPKPRQDDRI